MGESQQEQSLTTSTVTVGTIQKKTTKRSAKSTTTKRPAEKQDSKFRMDDPDSIHHPKLSQILMKQYKMTWGTSNGKRCLYAPSDAPQGAAQEVIAALNSEREQQSNG